MHVIGIVPVLCQFLTVPEHDMQIESAWCLTNIACGDSAQTEHVLGAVPFLIQLLSCQDTALQEQACWALGNIAGDADEHRSLLVAGGSVPAIAELMFTSCEGLLLWDEIGSGAGAGIEEVPDRRALTAAVRYYRMHIYD